MITVQELKYFQPVIRFFNHSHIMEHFSRLMTRKPNNCLSVIKYCGYSCRVQRNLWQRKSSQLAVLSSIPPFIAFVTFLPEVIAKFGRLDDFSFYLYTRNDVSGIIHSGFSYGRPITSFIIGETFSRVRNINDFSMLRFISIIFLCATIYLMQHFYLGAVTHHFVGAIVATVIVISLPGLWVFMTWAQGLPHMMAFFFVAIAVNVYANPKYSGLFYFFSFLSMFTYQPCGLLIPIILMSKLCNTNRDDLTRVFVKISTWTALLSILNFLTVKMQNNQNPRSEVTQLTQEKLRWILTEWIPRVVFPWTLNIDLLLSSITFFIFMYLSFNYIQKCGVKNFLFLLLSTFFPSIPFLVSTENWASSRAILASNLAFLILCIHFANKIDLTNLRRRFVQTSLAVTSFLIFIQSVNQGYGGLVFPQTMEWNTFSQQLSSLNGRLKEIKIDMTHYEQTPAGAISYDEFGILNSSVETALLGLIEMAKINANLTGVKVSISKSRVCQTKLSFFDSEAGILYFSPIAGTKGCT